MMSLTALQLRFAPLGYNFEVGHYRTGRGVNVLQYTVTLNGRVLTICETISEVYSWMANYSEVYEQFNDAFELI